MKIKFFSMIMAFVFVFMTCSTSLAAVNIDSFPSGVSYTLHGQYPYEEFFAFENFQGEIKVIHIYSQTPFVLDSYLSGTEKITIAYKVTEKDQKVYRANLTYTDGSWISGGTSNSLTLDYVYTNQAKTLYDSTFDIRESAASSELFFPVPPEARELYQIIQKVTTEEMTKQEPIVVGTMKILTVCGVSLIALLVVLSLFGKVFRTFHLK